MDDLPIRKVIASISDGGIRIPAFQRGFVWDAERVAYLMDSIYKGYPFGAVILWRTREKLKFEKNLGPFELPDPKKDYPVDYVLDGQQRLTSIFGVFQTEIEVEEEVDWTQIYFDLDAASDHQETQFFALSTEEVIEGRHFPIGTFFDSVAYREATGKFSAEQVRRIDDVQSVFKEAMLPIQQIETEDRAKVAIVFERVNRLGVELDVFQLLSAWTWSDEFDLQSQFGELATELAPFGFEGVGEDTNLILRCCSAVVKGDTSPEAVIDLNGAEVRERFDEIINGIRGAIDFLRKNLDVYRIENLPYSALLVPLTTFFAAKDGRGVSYSAEQREIIVRWFWRSCFSRRYSAAVVRNLKRDIEDFAKLKAGDLTALGSFAASVSPDYFLDASFSIRTVNTRTFVLLMAQQQPRSLVSGAHISLERALQAYNQNEFHHLYPRAYLRRTTGKYADNALANLAFISSQDNKILGGEAPSAYRRKMSSGHEAEILSSAMCGEILFDDNYDVFLADRAARLTEAASDLMS